MTQNFIPADTLSLALFLFVVANVIVMILWGAKRIEVKLSKQVAVFLVLWILVLSSVVLSGVLKNHTLPALPIFFAVINLGALAFGFSTWGKKFASLPIWMLVIFQAFRLPLEIALHLWAQQGTVPETMTWSGQNFDVVSGLLALRMVFNRKNPRPYAWFFNIVGFALLLNVLRVVAMSSPFPFAWNLTNPLMLALYMPYALIGIVCVWAALAGHIILTRALLKKP